MVSFLFSFIEDIFGPGRKCLVPLGFGKTNSVKHQRKNKRGLKGPVLVWVFFLTCQLEDFKNSIAPDRIQVSGTLGGRYG